MITLHTQIRRAFAVLIIMALFAHTTISAYAVEREPAPVEKETPGRTEAPAEEPAAEGAPEEEETPVKELESAEMQMAASSAGEEVIPTNAILPKPIGTTLKVAADEQTGALTYEYPFTLPPGRNGLTLDLALRYNSQNEDNGNFAGYGWDLSIPSITRIPRKGIDQLYTSTYFSSSLSGELKPITLTDGMHGTYGVESEFGSVLSYEFTAENQWIVKNQQGTTYIFGKTAASRQYDPAVPEHVYKWMLSEIRDSTDNYIRYEYDDYINNHQQLYPIKILYTGHGTTDGEFEVTLTHGTRDDHSVSYATGFKVKTHRRLKEITVSKGGQWVRKYTLDFAAGENGYRSLLKSITETGRSENGVEITLPKTTFDYTTSTKQWEKSKTYNPPPLSKIAYGFYEGKMHFDTGVRVTDLNGDGFPDYFTSNISWWAPETFESLVMINDKVLQWKKDSTFTIPVPFLGYGGNTNDKNDMGARLADVDGDGLTDIIFSNSTFKGTAQNPAKEGVHLNKGDGTWKYHPLSEYGATLKDIKYSIIEDINGDGLPDMVISWPKEGIIVNNTKQLNLVTQVWINQGNAHWEEVAGYTVPVPFFASIGGTEVRVNADFADMNADGLVDIIFKEDASKLPLKDYYPKKGLYLNNGHGWEWSGWPDVNLSDYQADINNDGLTDSYYSYTSHLDTYEYASGVLLNAGPSQIWPKDPILKLPIPIYFYHPIDGAYDLGGQLLDINGDGLNDLTRNYTEALPDTNGAYLQKGTRPDLLKTITHSSGASTTVTYQASHAYKFSSWEPANPKLPMVLYTVSAITTDDGYGQKATTGYFYEDGRYFFNTPLDRKFGGFASIRVSDPEGNVTKRYFHQGNETAVQLGEFLDHKAKINLAYRTEVFDTKGTLYQKSFTKWERSALPGDRSFVYASQELSQSFEGGISHKDTAIASTYDLATGNLLSETNYGEVQASDNGTFTDIGSDTVKTTTTYVTTPFFTALPSTTLTTDTSGKKVAESRAYYDNLPLSQASKGNRTKEEYWVSGSIYSAKTRSYDTYGMVTAESDFKGNFTTYAYDTFHLYPVSVKNPLNHTMTLAYDYSSGAVTKTVDPNGAVFETEYDSVDRPIASSAPDPVTGALVLISTSTYKDTFPQSITETQYLTENHAVTRVQYLDGLGRVVQAKKQMAGGQYATTDTSYTLRGQVQKSSLPYFSEGQVQTAPATKAALYTSYLYDPLGRPLTETTALGTTSFTYQPWHTVVTDALGHKKEFAYDAYGRLATVIEHNGTEKYLTSYTYDSLGNLTKITDAKGNTREFTYDALSRQLTATLAHAPAVSPGKWTMSYDDNGRVQIKTDPTGKTTYFFYDVLGRLKLETFAATAFPEYAFFYDTCQNGKGRLCSVKHNEVLQSSYAYTLRGEVEKETTHYPGGASLTHSTAYNYAGGPVSMIYPDQSTVSYTYDEGGFLASAALKSSGSTTPQALATLTFAPTGQILTQSYGNGVKSTYTYDENAWYLLKEKVTQKGSTTLQHLAYTFDSVGNITKIVDSSDAVTLSGQGTPAAKGDLNTSGAINVVDIQCSIITSLSVLNGQPLPICLNPQELSVADINCDSTVNVVDTQLVILLSLKKPFELSLDANGNQIVDTCEVGTKQATLAKTTTYAYDDLYRLTKTAATALNGGVLYDQSFQYDAVGNMVHNSKVGAYTYGLPGNVHAVTKAGEKTMSYDGNGNMSSTGTATYQWDYRDRMVSVTPQGTTTPAVTFTYDHSGQRLTKASAKGISRYVGEHFDQEVTEEGTLSRTHVVMGTEKVMTRETFVKAGTTPLSRDRYHHGDHLGSSAVETDDTGAVVELIDYYPYGTPHLQESSLDEGFPGEGATTPYKFTGKELDEETDLYYYGARYYMHEIGRFVSVDPFLQSSFGREALLRSEVGDILKSPQMWNIYSYALNNPLRYTDPTGKQAKESQWYNPVSWDVNWQTVGIGVVEVTTGAAAIAGGVIATTASEGLGAVVAAIPISAGIADATLGIANIVKGLSGKDSRTVEMEIIFSPGGVILGPDLLLEATERINKKNDIRDSSAKPTQTSIDYKNIQINSSQKKKLEPSAQKFAQNKVDSFNKQITNSGKSEQNLSPTTQVAFSYAKKLVNSNKKK